MCFAAEMPNVYMPLRRALRMEKTPAAYFDPVEPA
jgi:hypothetical protein